MASDYWYENLVAVKDPKKARWIRELIDRCHLRQITISQDLIRKLQLKHYHGHGYDFLLRQFVPMLEVTEVSEADIRTMLEDNPRHVFDPLPLRLPAQEAMLWGDPTCD